MTLKDRLKGKENMVDIVAEVIKTVDDIERRMTFLKEGRMGQDEWNNKIIPLVKNGTLKDRSAELPDHFLLIYQVLECLVEDTDGVVYWCTGWVPPGAKKGHVDIKRRDKQ